MFLGLDCDQKQPQNNNKDGNQTGACLPYLVRVCGVPCARLCRGTSLGVPSPTEPVSLRA